jgi:iron complex transport system substrate-binding protein
MSLVRKPARSILIPLIAAAALTGCRRVARGPTGAGGARVVSLAPSLTEIVCRLGGSHLLVGRTSTCDFPPDAVRDVPVIGGFGTPSLELLVAARPTLILDVDLEDESVARGIAELGLRRERVPCRALDDIPEAVTRIGSLLGLEDRARATADELRAGIATLRRNAAKRPSRPSVYVEIWNDPMTTAGKGTFLSELIHLAGGRNIGDEAEKPYFQVAPEWIVARDPDIILCLYMSENAAVREQVMARPGWQAVAAVRNGAVYDDLPNDVLLRPGPRVLEGIRALADRIRGREHP